MTIRHVISFFVFLPQSSSRTEIQKLRTSLFRLEENLNSDEARSQLSHPTTQTITSLKSQLAELTRQVKFYEDESITWKHTVDPAVIDPSRDNDGRSSGTNSPGRLRIYEPWNPPALACQRNSPNSGHVTRASRPSKGFGSQARA